MADEGSSSLPLGGMIIEPGNSRRYRTGEWRSQRPEVDKGKCTNCLTCWIYCPENSVLVENEKMTGFKYSHCKGCGICANQCPAKAITMREEGVE